MSKKTILVLGSEGLVGSSFSRIFNDKYNIINIGRKFDLKISMRGFLYPVKPDYVIVCAGKVGGIHANKSQPADFCYENSAIALNVLNSFSKTGVKLLYLGSSCIYPKDSVQPMKEEYLNSGKYEPTNEGYAVAKNLGVSLCKFYKEQYGDNYISAIPSSVYGPNDNFHPSDSHVIPSLIRKFIFSNKVVIWGDGSPIREFLYVDDLAKACVFLLENYNGSEPVNIGAKSWITIGNLVNLIKEECNFNGDVIFDSSKPNGMMKKILDSEKITKMGWSPEISIHEGIKETINWAKRNSWCFQYRYLCDDNSKYII